jgi:hypothetical protein
MTERTESLITKLIKRKENMQNYNHTTEKISSGETTCGPKCPNKGWCDDCTYEPSVEQKRKDTKLIVNTNNRQQDVILTAKQQRIIYRSYKLHY